MPRIAVGIPIPAVGNAGVVLLDACHASLRADARPTEYEQDGKNKIGTKATGDEHAPSFSNR
jgi:hypothetical protein